MREREHRLYYLILPLAALIAIAPLIVNGCSCGHDFDFHILSWFEAARQFTHGNLHPHWAYTPAFNAGEPRFVFYPPISWTIGAILGLITPHALGGWLWTPIVYTWLALTAACLSLYYLAKEFASHQAALIAAAFYIVNPYILFTAYERTAYAELLAAAWIPLLLHAILREKVTIPRIAIPVALLWLTNAPAAVMGCYALALLTVIRLIATAPNALTSRRQIAANTAAGTALGLGLAAFYILPAAYERRYVQAHMAIVPGVRIQDNFIFTHIGVTDHDGVLHTASVVAMLLILFTAAFIAISYLEANRSKKLLAPAPLATHLDSGKKQESTHPLLSLGILSLAIIFLLTPLSNCIWNHVPELIFLQFPWRLLAILAAIMGLSAAIALSLVSLRPIKAAIIAIAVSITLSVTAYTVFRQPCDEPDTVSARLALFRSNTGTDPTDEYAPTTADNDSLSQNNPPYWLAENPDAKAPSDSIPGPAPTHLTLSIPSPQTLILNLRDYPAWRITRNSELIAKHEQRDDGLIAIPLPAGTSNISITYAQTSDQALGDILTALSIILLVSTLRRHEVIHV
jgi:hypothetical protein